MAKCYRNWSQDDLVSATSDIKEKKMTFRKAEATYGIPRSTLHDYATGKVEIGCKPGPSSILTAAEEQRIVDYAIQMSKIGYGLTRERILEMVKKILDKDGRPNPFKENLPGRKWWELFLQRHPQLSVHKPEALQLARAHCGTPEVLQMWYSDFDQFLMTHNVKIQPTALKLLEVQMKPETLSCYRKRYEEKYDLDSDELYNIWSRLKTLSISSGDTEVSPVQHLPLKQQYVSPALDDIIKYPKVPQKNKSGRRRSQMPKHLSGTQMIDYLQEEKERRKKEREEKCKLKEAEKEKKFQEREEKRKKIEQVQKSKSSRGRGRGYDRGRKATGARAVGKEVCGLGESSSEGKITEARVVSNEGSSKEETPVMG